MNFEELLKAELLKATDDLTSGMTDAVAKQAIANAATDIAMLPVHMIQNKDASVLAKNIAASQAWRTVSANIVAKEIAAQAWSNLAFKVLEIALIAAI